MTGPADQKLAAPDPETIEELAATTASRQKMPVKNFQEENEEDMRPKIPVDSEGYLIPDCEIVPQPIRRPPPTNQSLDHHATQDTGIDSSQSCDSVFFSDELGKVSSLDEEQPLPVAPRQSGPVSAADGVDTDVVVSVGDVAAAAEAESLPAPTREETGNESLEAADLAVPRISEDTETVDTRVVVSPSTTSQQQHQQYQQQQQNQLPFHLNNLEDNEMSKATLEDDLLDEEPGQVFVLAQDQPETYHDCVSRLGSGDEDNASSSSGEENAPEEAASAITNDGTDKDEMIKAVYVLVKFQMRVSVNACIQKHAF